MNKYTKIYSEILVWLGQREINLKILPLLVLQVVIEVDKLKIRDKDYKLKLINDVLNSVVDNHHNVKQYAIVTEVINESLPMWVESMTSYSVLNSRKC